MDGIIDERLVKRYYELTRLIYECQTAIVQRFSSSRKEVVGSSRFFCNPRFQWTELASEMYAGCVDNCPNGHVLLIQDTCVLNYASKKGRFSETDPCLGDLPGDTGLGYMLHPGLAVNAKDGFPIGIAHLHMWCRPKNRIRKEKKEERKLPIEEKESFRWLSTAQEGCRRLSKADWVTVISDRESDIYETFCRIPNDHTQLLIRSSYNRRLANGKLLYEHLNSCPIVGMVRLPIKKSAKRKARIAQLEVRFSPITIKAPRARRIAPNDPENISIYAVELKEISSSIPEGEDGICWRLFTTHQVETLSQALQIAEWYSFRWWIEELFRLLKSQGLDIENSQLESGQALQKLAVSCLQAALRILMLRQEREGKGGYHAQILFTAQQIVFMHALLPQWQGKTKIQQNPYKQESLAWAAWIIARIGGWKGYAKSESPPGVITFRRGLESFLSQFIGWKTAMAS